MLLQTDLIVAGAPFANLAEYGCRLCRKDDTVPQQTIAVVDHSASFLRLMNTILSAEGFKMLSCPHGELAYESITREKPDLVIIDTWLQFEDEGWQVLQNLRLDPTTKDIPVIISSTDTANIAARTAELEAMAIVRLLAKPFTPEALLAAINDMLAAPAI